MLHIITGPPCSGKSTYVREHAQPNDVRVDFDAIAQCLGAATSHASEGMPRECAFKARTAVIKHLLAHADECDAWIIHTDPADWQRSAYEDAGAEFVELDVDMETCLARAREDDRPEGEDEAIRAWFARHEKGASMAIKYKAAPGAADMPVDGAVEGYAATFDRIPDSYGDIIAPGAFAASLDRWKSEGKPIPLLYGHNTDDPHHNIGKVTEAREDDRGLFVRCEFDADNELAQYARKLVKEGRLYQFSFAYEIQDAGAVALDDGTEAYELRQLDLFEVSLVQIPANQRATVTDIKQGAAHVKSGRRNSKADADELRRVLELADDITTTVRGLLADEDDDDPSDDTRKSEEPAGVNDEDAAAKAYAALMDEVNALLKSID